MTAYSRTAPMKAGSVTPFQRVVSSTGEVNVNLVGRIPGSTLRNVAFTQSPDSGFFIPPRLAACSPGLHGFKSSILQLCLHHLHVSALHHEAGKPLLCHWDLSAAYR